MLGRPTRLRLSKVTSAGCAESVLKRRHRQTQKLPFCDPRDLEAIEVLHFLPFLRIRFSAFWILFVQEHQDDRFTSVHEEEVPSEARILRSMRSRQYLTGASLPNGLALKAKVVRYPRRCVRSEWNRREWAMA